MASRVFCAGCFAVLPALQAFGCGIVETSVGAHLGAEGGQSFGDGGRPSATGGASSEDGAPSGAGGNVAVAGRGAAIDAGGVPAGGGTGGFAAPDASCSLEDAGCDGGADVAIDTGSDASAVPEGGDTGCPAADAGSIAKTTGPEGRSCAGGLDCHGTSCCENIVVPGGPFPMGRGQNGTDAYPDGAFDEIPERIVHVSEFYLDTFEVTVGRFRAFVDSYEGTPLVEGAGAHPLIAGSGWQSTWDAELPATREDLVASLHCAGDLETWTDTVGDNELKPITCVTWYMAFAFCIWDGGRLPTEAEWEKAAAGGDENRLYPWGREPPTGLSEISCLVVMGAS